MGYSPAVIGLSYVPQTIAFLIGGYGCRAAAEMARQAVITVVAGAVCCQRHCDWAAGFISHVSLVEILIPFCVMAIANGAIYPIVVAGRCVPSTRNWSRRSVAEHSSTGSVLPRKVW